jgi:transcriptional regulator with PAS, ATPase and Fis domain
VKRTRNKPAAIELLDAALEALGGATVILDARLAIVRATPAAVALIGTELPVGVSAPRVLCGGAVNRPIADALAKGIAITGTLERPRPDGATASVRIRATPLEPQGERIGWVLQLDETRAALDDAPVLFHGLWARSAEMKRVFHVVERAAPRDATVLIRGETGTGKELIAQALHALSQRRRGPFAAINCAALPPSLLESELFGHVRGAFTGALRDAPGFFRSAHGGTVFLDELGEMPLELQAKLLRVLETRTVIPVGGRTAVPVDVRVVAATHRSLRDAVAQGAFRADLMYRLRVVPIFLPPLRQRPADVPLLTEKLIDELNTVERKGRRVLSIAPAASAALAAYPWPGNVRELRNALEYAYVVGDGPVLEVDELPPEIAGQPESIDVPSPPLPSVAAPSDPDAVERQRIERALERAAGHRERAAQILGISRVTLWRRMSELGIA